MEIRSSRRRIGILSTYPPKLCGLATFAAALGDELRGAGHRVDVVRLDDGNGIGAIGHPVVAELVNGDPASIERAAAMLSRCDVAIIQHEYGIYGGKDGEEVLDVLAVLDAPAIVVLHTVPLRPTAHQRSVLEAVCDGADRVVVMAETARKRLLRSYRVDGDKVVMIPHGASVSTAHRIDGATLDPADPQLLTWGLLGPGKGIEHVIDALAVLGDITPRPRYTVAGVTHPKVFTAQGDKYRLDLIQRSWAHGVAGSVTFDDTYRNVHELTAFISSASVVVLPYDSRDQVTSGVLVDAIAAGRPVVATAFPHAVELLKSGAGTVVPHGDPVALAGAIREIVCDRDVWESMAAEARRIAPTFSWAAVADQYVRLSTELLQVAEPVAI
jgi:glycosyltransferase involved in cell wall biosynthesis